MGPNDELEILPPVRTNVFKHSLLIVGLYIVVGIFMMVAVFLASGTTPKAIHLNYDSIAAASQMNQAWSALKNPAQYPGKGQAQWVKQFETALHFEEGNLTEAGENSLAKNIRALWTETQARAVQEISDSDFQKMESYFDQLTQVNEQGMFNWVARSHHFSRTIFIVTLVLFLITILIALFLADSLAVKIATPLRNLSAALKTRPEPGAALKLPKPETLEIRILTRTLGDLWQGFSKLQALNLEEISMQRKKLETVLTSVEDAILVLDNQNAVIHCNDGFLKFLKLTLPEMMGKVWDDLPVLSSNYLNLREHLTPKLTTDQTIELEMGSQNRIFAPRHRAILDEKEHRVGNLYLLHDITEIRQKDRLRAEFIGVLSHELKTPLQSLGTASELLLNRKSDFGEDDRMLIETIFDDVGRIKGVANEFIQVGISNLHSLRLKIEPVAIEKLVPQWVQPFYVLAKDKNVKIELKSEFTSSAVVKIDTVKFSWAIANLLSNALRVSPPDSVILVQVSQKEHQIQIEIQDQGPGIPLATQKRMFEPYFQGGTSGSEKTSGFLGLGLTITKEVVEAHEGSIEYEELSPHGSRFRIKLPEVR